MHIERPQRVRHTYTQQLCAPPQEVFPLLCPVREADWIPGWDPLLVLSESGVAEEDCIFVTPGEPEDAVWIVSRHDAENHRLTMYKVIPGVTVTRLDIALTAGGTAGTRATVSYEHTALGPRGEELLHGFTAEHYREFMEEWEERLNHHLRTGEVLISA